MYKSAMSPEVGVVDAESESNYIHIGDDRTSHSEKTDTFGSVCSVEKGADANGCDRMGKD
ncbi:MAG TPA: hypothetical protein VMI32_10040 [Candidatus Solibacter sp.]|nr:hypothetical protein [Candidatus Solibacter sp.]